MSTLVYKSHNVRNINQRFEETLPPSSRYELRFPPLTIDQYENLKTHISISTV